VVETSRIHTRLPSAAKLPAKVGQRLEVIVDDTDADGIATCRTGANAPEIDGTLSSTRAPRRCRFGKWYPSRSTRRENTICVAVCQKRD
jgi:hypothetical protein